jgi:hypothetical protein
MILLALVAAAGLAAEPRAADGIRLFYQDSVRIERPGTTAAYAVNVAIVEASVSPTQVTLVGVGVGTTRVTVVGPGGVETWNVVVESPPSTLLKAASDARRTTIWSEHYDSETSRVTSALSVFQQTSKGWPVALDVVNLTKARETNDGFARTTFPLASLSIGTARRGVILGDEQVTRSPLTLDGNLVRGAHVRTGRIEAHAGFASSLMLGSLFVPAERETTAGISYAFGSPTFRVSPSLYAFPDAPDKQPGARALLPGILVEKEGKNGLFLLGEAGWSGGLGAAAEAAYDTPANRVHLRLRHQPYALPALSIGHPRGSFADVSWSGRFGRRLGATVTGASARFDDPRAPRSTAGGSADVAWIIATHLSARGGMSAGRYDAVGAPRVETLGETIGLAFDTGRVGASALYRHQTNSATNRGGPGGHLEGHVGGRLRLSAYADYQRDAPTLSLLLDDYPEIARALAEQGLVARTPEDIARLLDASALLLAGDDVVLLTLDPARAQAGVDLTWSGAHTRVHLHGLADRTETTSATRETRVATLSVTQAFGSSEMTAGYAWWSSDVAPFGESGGAFTIGFRQRFAGGVPGSSRRARIAGQVYREVGASEQPTMIGVPGITIRLGDGRSAVTDAGGNFRFDDVGKRGRRVQAILPAGNAFFTTPSTVEVKDSAVVRFGLRFAEGRLGGTVRDDAGQAFGGLTLRLRGPGGAQTAVSNDAGGFVFGAAAGDYVLEGDGASLPPGYELADDGPRAVRVSLADPVSADVAVRAQRSVSGRLEPPGAGVEVRLKTARRAARTDAQGRYLFRSVGPGLETVEATIAGRLATRAIDVPAEPASLRDVDLGAASPGARAVADSGAPAPAVVTRAASSAPTGWRYFVQYSAHRDRAEAVTEAERLGALLGLPVRVVAADVPGRGVYYRVLAGEFTTAAAAQRHRAEAIAHATEVGPVHRIATGGL